MNKTLQYKIRIKLETHMLWNTILNIRKEPILAVEVNHWVLSCAVNEKQNFNNSITKQEPSEEVKKAVEENDPNEMKQAHSQKYWDHVKKLFQLNYHSPTL